MKIMLIDDDEAIRMMLQDIIEDYNLGEVAVSLDSAATLNNGLLALHHIDILIIDMLMPGIDGIEAVTKIKKGFFCSFYNFFYIKNSRKKSFEI